MTKFIRTLLFLTLLLFACSPAAISPAAPAVTAVSNTPASLPAAASAAESAAVEAIPVSTTEALPAPRLIATLSTPHIDQGPDGAVTAAPTYPRACGYQWAQQSLPELSNQFMQSMQALQPGAQGSAFVFGENCVYADGTSTFIPMETDFNITIPVGDTTDTAALGEWVVRIMDVIENVPPDQIVGPRPGRVSILFENVQQEGVTFYIDQYDALPAGLIPAEIYQSLKSPQ